MQYRLTEKIGSGGMAEVFRAVGVGPQGFERPFVIKRIHPHLSQTPEFVRMFVDEAKISARLIHPNIVQVFEFAHHEGSYYIVMEPVDGIDMAWFARRPPEKSKEHLPTTFIAEVGRQVCRGLDFAHTLTGADGRPLGIVHRDVTPPNIMVAWNGTVKILDFGIARAAEALRTKQSDAGIVKGKMSYVAPELLEGERADARSDVFSLGVVLHELLTSRRLFVGDNDLETLKLVKGMPIPAPSVHNPGVKPALDAVVMRALERDPAKRYRNAGQMGDELEALVLRKSYSTRALARKARELAGVDEHAPPPSMVTAPESAPIVIGHEDSSAIVTGSPRRPSPSRPPPPPAAAVARRPADPRTWIAAGACLTTVVALGLVWAVLHRPVVVAVPSPSVAGRPPIRTVKVAVDSDPQGASVTTPALSNGAPLGDTPLILELPRGDAPIEVTFAKTGFAPLVYRLIPLKDRDVAVRLERSTPPTTLSPLPAGPVARTKGSRAMAARHAGMAALRSQLSNAQRSTTAAPTTAGPTPGQPRPAGAPVATTAPVTMPPAHHSPASSAHAGAAPATSVIHR